MFALVVTPILSLIQIQPVSGAPTTVLTHKWTRAFEVGGTRGTNWEGGVVIGDVTGDGIEDVVYAAGGLRTIYVLNGTNGNDIATYSNNRISQYCQPQLYDVDGDGILDILVPLYYTPGLAAVQYDGDSSLSPMWVVNSQGTTGSGTVMAKPVAGDIDGDGDLDIFLASQDVSPNGGYDGTIIKITHEGVITHSTFTWRACSGGLSLADTDNDGVFELYQGDRQMGYTDGGYGKGAKSYWAENLTERWIRLDDLTSSQAPVIADVNGDGIKDIIAGMYGVQYVYNSTNGGIIYSWTNNRDLSVHYGTTVYDIDGDGNLELLCNDGDHDNDPYTDVFDLVTGEMDAQLSLAGGDTKWSPTVADISTSNPGMEIIITPNGTSIDGWRGVLMIYNSNFESIQNVTANMNVALSYPFVQDIDGDGYLEVVTIASAGYVYAFDTAENAPAPGYSSELPGSKRIRSEVTYFGEMRLGVAEHTIMPWAPDYWTAPLVAPISPGDNELAVPTLTGQLSFKVREHQSDSLTYSVSTSPDIGSRSGSISSGTYNWNTLTVPISNLEYDTTYKWTVTVSDGSEITSRTYTFRTEHAPNEDNSAPSQGTPALVTLGGVGSITSTFECSAQGTSDTDGDDVTNIYRWTVNDEPVAQLLLPFDTRDELSAADYSGFGNDGIVKGATWVPNGIVGGAYSFDGKDDAIIVSDGGAGYFNDINYPSNNEELGGFGNWNAVTVEAWIHLTEYNNGSRIVAKIPSYALGFQSGSTNRLYGSVWPMTYEVADPEDDPNESSLDRERSVSANVPIELNTWYHVAFTYESGVGLKLYFNGQLVGQSSATEGPVKISRGEPLYIGRLVQPFAGMIDEVRLHNYAQPAEQIYNRYMESKDGNSSSSLFLPLSIATSGDELGCDVIPTDSYAEGTTLSISTPIQNPLPVASNLNIYPVRDRAYRLDNENLGASYDYYDVEGELESGTQIRWYRNGELQTALNDLLEVPASSTSIDQTWYFTVTPRDSAGYFGELQTSEPITIRGNNVPITGTPTLDSVNGGDDSDDEDLIGTAATTTDADSDSTTNIYRWLKNGVSMTNLQMPFDTEIPRLSSSNGIATDYSGYGNHGSVNGSTWVQDGVIGGALSFDGNDYITVEENDNSLGSSGSWSEITVEYWVKATGTTSTESVVSMHNVDYSTGGWQGDPYGIAYSSDFRAYSNRDRFYWEVFNDTGSAEVQYSEYVTFGQWHHVVCTYESGVGLKLYVDGLERATAALTGNINGTSDGLMFIGGTGSGADFSGLLDEVRIYPNALSSIQIFQRYLDTKDGVSDSETITGKETTVGDAWVCEVIPNDSWVDGTSRTSTTLTVVSNGDGAPYIYMYSPEETEATVDVNEILTFTQFSSDPDNDDDELTYSWTLNGVEQATTKDWTFNFTSQGTYTVRVTVSDGSLTDYQEWTITVNPPAGGYNLTILSATNGNTNPVPGNYSYADGAVASVQAIPDAGYMLSYWLLNGTNYSSTNPCTITMSENYELQPVFIVDPTPYTLTVTIVGEGSVTKNPDQATYTYGTDVSLTANPAEGYKFTGWSGDASGEELTTVVDMTGNKAVTATFTVDLPNLFEDGFESGDFSQWGVPTPTEGETATVLSNLRHDGSYGARFTTDGDGGIERVYIYKNIEPQTELYVRAYFNIQSGLPLDADNNRFNLFSFVSGGNVVASMGVIRNNGADVWYINSGLGVWNATSGPVIGDWYCVEFYMKIGTTDGVLSAWVDEVPVVEQTGRNTAAIANSIDLVRCELVYVNGVTHPLEVYSDCIVLSNSYIGPEDDEDPPTEMDVNVGTDRARYTKWSYVQIEVNVKDGAVALQNANVDIAVYDTHGRVVWTATGTTDADGNARFTYKLVFNAQMGTYTVEAEATLDGYTPSSGQTTFYSLG